VGLVIVSALVVFGIVIGGKFIGLICPNVFGWVLPNTLSSVFFVDLVVLLTTDFDFFSAGFFLDLPAYRNKTKNN
jgi:hypothetical protein